MNSIDYFFGRLIRFSILFFILYMIFTNFGTFLIVITVFIILGYYFIYKKIQKIREQQSHFQFHFNAKDFQQGAQGFRFEDFQNFQSGNFQAQPQFGEVQKAKEFFGFTHSPTKEEIKKRYKELARKYHPDINNQGDALMKDLNHYRDVLMSTVS
ncbi:MAG: J domain-containing protein [Candidatus Marinarcus sp.]|uniref:J domain-containing protein n=1 Tax=Candidatus Marinarcus sp. TaxID=3100987 RepID=UPI003AFFCB05